MDEYGNNKKTYNEKKGSYKFYLICNFIKFIKHNYTLHFCKSITKGERTIVPNFKFYCSNQDSVLLAYV